MTSNWEENEIRKGIELYQRAVTLKPNSAAAHAALAGAWIVLSDLHVSPREGMPKATDEALKAIELDTRLPNAHINLGLVNCSMNGTGRAQRKNSSAPLSSVLRKESRANCTAGIWRRPDGSTRPKLS